MPSSSAPSASSSRLHLKLQGYVNSEVFQYQKSETATAYAYVQLSAKELSGKNHLSLQNLG